MYKKIYNPSDSIQYSIVTPVYNQEAIIVENIQSFIQHTAGIFEIILVLDYCFDATEKIIMEFFESYVNDVSGFTQITIFKNTEKPLFETKCDNIGFKAAVGKYCLEIQADMKMTQTAYNIELTKPFKLLDTVIAVSGRCAHTMFSGKGIGKLGKALELPISALNVSPTNFYVFETCNRGPLLLDKQKLAELNYLDEEQYFLDDSDHDLMARAYLQKKYICGYVPIDFDSPLHAGSTRNENKYNQCREYVINEVTKRKLKIKMGAMPGLLQYYKDWKVREPLAYDISGV